MTEQIGRTQTIRQQRQDEANTGLQSQPCNFTI